MPEKADEKKINNDKEYWEARENLFGFFSLLLKVDRRISPHLYKKQKNKKDKKDDR